MTWWVPAKLPWNRTPAPASACPSPSPMWALCCLTCSMFISYNSELDLCIYEGSRLDIISKSPCWIVHPTKSTSWTLIWSSLSWDMLITLLGFSPSTWLTQPLPYFFLNIFLQVDVFIAYLGTSKVRNKLIYVYQLCSVKLILRDNWTNRFNFIYSCFITICLISEFLEWSLGFSIYF